MPTKWPWLLFSLMSSASCGSEEPPAEPLVDGRWTYERSGCSGVLDFDGRTVLGGTYEHVFTCLLESGDYGVQVSTGTYEAFPERVALRARESSCPAESPYPVSYPYTLDGDQLALQEKGAVWLLAADESDHGPASGRLVYGCWADGAFSAHAVTAL